MARFGAIILILTSLLIFGGGIAAANATAVTTNETIEVVRLLDACDEQILLTGRLHVLIHATENANGGFNLVIHRQPQGITGLGLDSGATYQATGATLFTTTANAGLTDSYTNSFKIIGRGAASNFLVQETYQLTVDANGNVRTAFYHFFVECR